MITLPDVRGHVAGLVGTTIQTVTGHPNHVLAVDGDEVIVGTGRSPAGQPVAIAEIEVAARMLEAEGEIAASPEATGSHRSAFVAAVLATMPGVDVLQRPARLRLRSARPARQANPPWSFPELVLALDLYKREGQLGDGDPLVIELSHVLNSLPRPAGARVSGTFRNPNGVAMKLGNLARLDPDYQGAGLSRGGRRDEEVWDRFDGRDEELHRLAAELRAGILSGTALPPERGEEPPEVEKLRNDAADAARGNAGPLRRQSATERRAVELRAMKLAEDHFRAEGWDVDDVSKNQPYDLVCRRGEHELRVEVKGTTSERPQVALTANEVVHAREHPGQVALAFVSAIMLTGRDTDTPAATGGELRLLDPWLIDDGVLEAVAFAYTLPQG